MKKIFYLLVLSLFLVSCADKKWEEAQLKNTLAGYEKYVSENPESEHITEADSLIIVFKNELTLDSLAWEMAKEDGKKEDFERYISEYPEGIFVEEAKFVIEKFNKAELADDDLWEQSSSENTFYSYSDYLNLMPNGKHKEEAKEKRNVKFLSLKKTDFKEITNFFQVAWKVYSSQQIDTITQDSLFTYFSENECFIDRHEILGGVTESSLISGRSNYIYSINNILYFTGEYQKGILYIDDYEVTKYGTTTITISLNFDDGDTYGELFITFEKDEVNNVFQITNLETYIESPGC